MAFSYAVALTGGIGTGKSTVVQILLQEGFEVIDADRIAHQVLNEQKETISQMFGANIIKENAVDRKALGVIVFANKHKRQALESLLHPLIYECIVKKSELLDSKKKIYFVDIPLFFESKRYDIAKVLLVYTTKKIQLERLMARDKSNIEQAKQRINAQMDIDEKVKNAQYVIDNSGTLLELKRKTLEMIKKIKKDFK